MDKKEVRVQNLISYVKRLGSGKNLKNLYADYIDYIDEIEPDEAFTIFYTLLEDGYEVEEILEFLNKAINAFYNTLNDYNWERPDYPFLNDLLEENEALFEKLDCIKVILKEPNFKKRKEILLPKVKELEEFYDHYLKKENILFPYMEKVEDKFKGLSIMWELHNEIKDILRRAIEILENDNSSEDALNRIIGEIFFGMIGLIRKEEIILFPTACEILPKADWDSMYKQSLEYEFPFLNREKIILENNLNNVFKGGIFKTDTGELNFDEILMIFNNLPVDITFVDENNKVRFFSTPKDKIFPRSPAVIGREVSNCHPPASVHIVEEIVENFREGKENSVKFWLNMGDKTILIRYFALWDKEKNYRGVLEVSEDITDIKVIKGERRLLSWES